MVLGDRSNRSIDWLVVVVVVVLVSRVTQTVWDGRQKQKKTTKIKISKHPIVRKNPKSKIVFFGWYSISTTINDKSIFHLIISSWNSSKNDDNKYQENRNLCSSRRYLVFVPGLSSFLSNLKKCSLRQTTDDTL